MRGVKKVMNRAVKTIRANHDDARVWVTEVGWSSQPPGSQHQPGATNLRVGAQRQAKLVALSYRTFARQSRRWRLDRVYYFSWRDNPGGPPQAWSTTAGLRRADLTPKPAWRAFTRAAAHFSAQPR